MNRTCRTMVVAVVATLTTVLGEIANACSIHGSGAEEVDWLTTGATGTVVHGLLTLETFLVPPTSPTTCTAGIGLGSLSNPLPPGVTIVGMSIAIVNPVTGSRRPLTAFSLAPNQMTSDALAAGSGSSSVPNTNPLFAGSLWFGFSSPVQPFAQPLLLPGEFIAFQFMLEADRALVPIVLDVQFAAGQGTPDGKPVFDGPHPAQYFTAANRSVPVTEPAVAAPALSLGWSALTVVALGLLGVTQAARRRRRAINLPGF